MSGGIPRIGYTKELGRYAIVGGEAGLIPADELQFITELDASPEPHEGLPEYTRVIHFLLNGSYVGEVMHRHEQFSVKLTIEGIRSLEDSGDPEEDRDSRLALQAVNHLIRLRDSGHLQILDAAD